MAKYGTSAGNDVSQDFISVMHSSTLKHWLNSYSGKRKGFIVDQKSYRTQMEKIRIHLGYKVRGKNPDGAVWHTDICRHSYASYWLQKFNERGHLAEQMGNSIKMIKKHYKQVVKNSDTDKFWSILPASVVDEMQSDKERLKKLLMRI